MPAIGIKKAHYWGFLILWVPFIPIILANRTFLLGDCATVEIPMLTYLFQNWGEDWCPCSNGGMPTVAYLLGRIHYWPQFIFAFALPQKLALYYSLMHQLAAFFSALIYLTHRSFSRGPALLGALTYAGSSALIQLGLNFVFLPMLALAPLLLYFLEKMLQRPGPRICLGLSVVLSMLLSGGGWQLVPVFAMNISVAVCLDYFWIQRQKLPGRACLFWFSLAALLALIYWLPIYTSLKTNYLSGPVRASDLSPFMGGRFGVSDQFPLQTIFPMFYGPLAALSEKIHHPNHEFVAIAGAALFPLFLLGLRPLPNRRRWVWVWLGLILVDFFLSFGGENPVYRSLQANIPGLAKLRGPLRLLIPFPLVSMFLVASGLETLQGRKSSSWAALALYYFAYLIWGRPDFLAPHLLLLLSLGAAIGYCRLEGKPRMISLLLAAICQVSAPVLFVEKEFYSDDSTCIKEVHLLNQLKSQLENPLVGMLYAINTETTSMAGVRNVAGISTSLNKAFIEYLFFALYKREMTAEEFETLRWLSFCPAALLSVEPIAQERWSSPMMQMLSLHFLVLPEAVLPLQPHFRGFWISRSATVEADPVKVRKSMDQLDYNPQDRIFLDKERQVIPGYSPGEPSVTNYSPSKYTISLNGASGWLVLSSLYYPGWSARVDGLEVELSKANTTFIALPIQPGSKTVEFSFVDVGLASYGWGPLAACLGWAFLFFLGRKSSSDKAVPGNP